MTEKAFTLDHDCKLYKDYFRSLEEKKHFARLGSEFLKSHGIPGDKFALTPRLHIRFSSEEREAYATQLLKDTDDRGFSIFKLKSPIGKAWAEEVISNVDMEALDCTVAWWIEYVGRGSYALWDYEGNVYGYLANRADEEMNLPSYMKPITLSLYYWVLESAEASDKR